MINNSCQLYSIISTCYCLFPLTEVYFDKESYGSGEMISKLLVPKTTCFLIKFEKINVSINYVQVTIHTLIHLQC